MSVNQTLRPHLSSLSLLTEKLLEEFLNEKEYRFYAYNESMETWFTYAVHLLRESVQRRYSLSVKEERHLSALTSQVIVQGCPSSYLTLLIAQLGVEAERYLKKHAYQIHYSPKEVLSMIELVRQFTTRCKATIDHKANIVLLPSIQYSEAACTMAD
ncbi:hypothetical protein [Jeotgalibacillus salarius]|uniref:Uncharacterized protein n=1 Tax=Jeotgalibacillus salarius TaxID=546023 RepID=A0A4Y8LJA9_9BACL|nr:hypothetical protein [Jeotgalibacillus salarius]TFE02285.1 hypothetical protein E2626_06815 [Jeotgalibacillus salarius]